MHEASQGGTDELDQKGPGKLPPEEDVLLGSFLSFMHFSFGSVLTFSSVSSSPTVGSGLGGGISFVTGLTVGFTLGSLGMDLWEDWRW